MDQETSEEVVARVRADWDRDLEVAEMAADMMKAVSDFAKCHGLHCEEVDEWGERRTGVVVHVADGMKLFLTLCHVAKLFEVRWSLEMFVQMECMFYASFNGREGGQIHRFGNTDAMPWLRDDGNTRSIDAWLRWVLERLEQSVLN